jgi:hypothetical protein
MFLIFVSFKNNENTEMTPPIKILTDSNKHMGRLVGL